MAKRYNHPRAFERTHCEIKIDYSTAESFREAYMMQVGKGGLFIQSEKPLHLGTKVSLSFNLPGASELIRAKGKVIWRMENNHHASFEVGNGIKFTEISETDKNIIDNYVKNCEEESSENFEQKITVLSSSILQ